jgi:hypothetical protein
VEAGEKGVALDIAGMAYAGKHLTDGFISDNVLPGLYPPLKQPRKVANHLVEVGRWERDDARRGFWIHDYLEHNFSAEEAAERRAKQTDRGTRGAAARWANAGRTERKADASKHDSIQSSEVASGIPESTSISGAPSRPVPSEVKNPLTPTPNGVGEHRQAPKNSRAHGTNPRHLAAEANAEARKRDGIQQAARLGEIYAKPGRTLEAVVDLLADKGLECDQLEAAKNGFLHAMERLATERPPDSGDRESDPQ